VAKTACARTRWPLPILRLRPASHTGALSGMWAGACRIFKPGCSMKSLHYYRQAPVLESPTPATSIPLEQQEILRGIFDKDFRRYRVQHRTAMCLTVGLAIAFWCSLFILPRTYVAWAGVGFVVAVVLGVLSLVIFPFPICPACQRLPTDCTGAFCPECGAQALEPGMLLIPPRCFACKKKMSGSSERRRYKIHACTHCGLWLSDEGV
jgi:hypothetical protein